MEKTETAEKLDENKEEARGAINEVAAKVIASPVEQAETKVVESLIEVTDQSSRPDVIDIVEQVEEDPDVVDEQMTEKTDIKDKLPSESSYTSTDSTSQPSVAEKPVIDPVVIQVENKEG